MSFVWTDQSIWLWRISRAFEILMRSGIIFLENWSNKLRIRNESLWNRIMKIFRFVLTQNSTNTNGISKEDLKIGFSVVCQPKRWKIFANSTLAASINKAWSNKMPIIHRSRPEVLFWARANHLKISSISKCDSYFCWHFSPSRCSLWPTLVSLLMRKGIFERSSGAESSHF